MATATTASALNARVSRHPLLIALEMCAKAAPPRDTIPILSCLKIEAVARQLTITATDLEITITRTVDDVDITAPGDTCVNAASIRDAVRACTSDEVELSVSDNMQLTVRGGSATFRILALAGEDFPTLPPHDGKDAFEIETWKLQNALRATSFAVDTGEETRFRIDGVLLKTNQKMIEFAATDGHRMSIVNYPIGKVPDVEMVIPRAAIPLIQKLEGERVIISTGRHLGFVSGNATISARTQDIHFPNYRYAITKPEYSVKIGRERLLGAVTGVALFAENQSLGPRSRPARKLRFEFKEGRLFIASADPSRGSAADSIAVEFSGPPGVVLGVNSQYIREALEAIPGENALLECTDGSGPVNLGPADEPSETDPKEMIHVIMPIRVQ